MFLESASELPPVRSMFARTEANLALVRGTVVADGLKPRAQRIKVRAERLCAGADRLYHRAASLPLPRDVNRVGPPPCHVAFNLGGRPFARKTARRSG